VLTLDVPGMPESQKVKQRVVLEGVENFF